MIANAQSAYRRIVPNAIRSRLWNVRSTGHVLFSDERAMLRARLADFYMSIGKHQAVVRTNVGTRLLVDLRDKGVGWPLFVTQTYEPNETQFIARTLKPGDVFVDIGANLGYFTTYASRLVGSQGKVVAFEPDPDHCAMLRNNLELNAADNVVVQAVALGDENRSGKLFRSPTNYGDHRLAEGTESRGAVPITVCRFDECCAALGLDRVNLIKIDVQGYEPYVRAGMGESLHALGVSAILMEFWPYGIRYAGGCPAALLETFLDGGFRIHELGPAGELLPRGADLVERVEALNRARSDAFVNLVLQR